MEEMKDDKELCAIVEGLTPKNRIFINLLLEGKRAVDAYRLAGYTGAADGAHVLKWRLRDKLEPMARARGMTVGDLMSKMSSLMEMDLVHYDRQGNAHPVNGITVDQMIRLLSLQKEVLLLQSGEGPKRRSRIDIAGAVEATKVSSDPKGS